ncbi:MAG TPA: hypothetical protein VNU71_03465 [Burkholderiaceae bacterium]|nr:hypothetical protein [Burkholderiaceae bacterium]
MKLAGLGVLLTGVVLAYEAGPWGWLAVLIGVGLLLAPRGR